MTRSLAVELTCDLTKYHPSLTAGSVGRTVGPGRNDCFARVAFSYTTLDVLWKSLDILDEDFLEEQRKERDEDDQAIIAAGVPGIVHTGPNGGFHAFSMSYTRDGCTRYFSQGNREEARRLIMLFRDNNIPVIEKREQRRPRKLPFGYAPQYFEKPYPITSEI